MMTNSWMEVLSPTAAYLPNSNWLLDQRTNGNWTQQENKQFEDALAYYDEDTPDRWKNVAEMIPGKTVGDVISHYRDLVEDVKHIEDGLIPFPGYSSSFMLDWERSQGYEGLKQAYCGGGKRSGARTTADHERKKGVPWTEEEHRSFLMGLNKYGKGDWRNISRNFVVSRTPTQVASHAQKYFIRLNSGSKDKRRSSIHDITTINIPDNRPPSPSQSCGLSLQSSLPVAPTRTSEQFSAVVDSKQRDEAGTAFASSAQRNPFMEQPYGLDPYRMKSQAQHLHRGTLHNSIVGQHGMMFQMQTVQPHPHG